MRQRWMPFMHINMVYTRLRCNPVIFVGYLVLKACVALSLTFHQRRSQHPDIRGSMISS